MSGLLGAERLVHARAQAAGAGADARAMPKAGPAQGVAPGSFLDLLLRTVDKTTSRGLTDHEIANQAPRPYLPLVHANGGPWQCCWPRRCVSLAQGAWERKRGRRTWHAQLRDIHVPAAWQEMPDCDGGRACFAESHARTQRTSTEGSQHAATDVNVVAVL